MIRLTFTVDSISTVIQVYNQIQVQRSATETGTFATVSGLGPVSLVAGTSSYTLNDVTGSSTDWYTTRYYSTTTGYYSDWSDPVLGESGDIFYNPLYPEEISYGTAQQLVIKRIRRLIGDPIRVRREFGQDALSYVHQDGKTFELPETGWPASVIMGGVAYSSINNPIVDGYKYLKFSSYIGDVCETCVTYSGCDDEITKDIETGVDVWYYTFRNSDRQIMEAYDTCPAPSPLTSATANSEVYMVQTAIDLLRKELWEDATEDGAAIKDEGSHYNPEPGLKVRKQLLDDLVKRRDDLVKALQLTGITGVLID